LSSIPCPTKTNALLPSDIFISSQDPIIPVVHYPFFDSRSLKATRFANSE
jgi:hypothetical protein